MRALGIAAVAALPVPTPEACQPEKTTARGSSAERGTHTQALDPEREDPLAHRGARGVARAAERAPPTRQGGGAAARKTPTNQRAAIIPTYSEREGA